LRYVSVEEKVVPRTDPAAPLLFHMVGSTLHSDGVLIIIRYGGGNASKPGV